jgi:hypothetical protein
MNLVNDIPELNMAITSVLLANFEVNQIIERNKKIGKSKLETHTLLKNTIGNQ